MNATPHTDPPLEQLREARATASVERASTSRFCGEFMTKIKKAKHTKKDVKNEGCSQDLVENKGRKYTNSHKANIFMKINTLSEMPIC